MSIRKKALNRRQFLRVAGTTGASLALAACAPFDPSVLEDHGKGSHDDKMESHDDGMMAPKASETTAMESGSTVSVFDMGDTKIHTYTGGPAGNGTYVVESANSLVLVDAQFAAPIAQEFRGYADGLGKSIDRLILTTNTGVCVAC
ncbi:MAG: twin-arginine translocation signal domain-containing protein [Chloroflexota bacterium]